MAFPWMALIGLAGQTIGHVLSSENNASQEELIKENSRRQQAFYNKLAEESPLETSGNKALLNNYDRYAEDTLDTAEAKGKILGTTPEYRTAVQKKIAEGRADLLGNIAQATANDRRKYLQLSNEAANNESNQLLSNMKSQQSSFANLISNSTSAIGNIVGAYTGGGATSVDVASPSMAPAKAPEKLLSGDYSENVSSERPSALSTPTDEKTATSVAQMVTSSDPSATQESPQNKLLREQGWYEEGGVVKYRTRNGQVRSVPKEKIDFAMQQAVPGAI